jgi:hypothetical protein
MTAHDHRLRVNLGFHPRVSDSETRRREAVLRIAEKHFTVEEFSELIAEMAEGKLDVRIYDDGIVLMRQF